MLFSFQVVALGVLQEGKKLKKMTNLNRVKTTYPFNPESNRNK